MPPSPPQAAPVPRLLAELVPAEVSAVEAFGDVDGWLYPAEAALIARAVPRRRDEFTTVRTCARAALARLGVPPAPILRGERGAPGWPDGIVGSMTHCDGYRAAAVARAGRVRTIGVDAEPHAPLPEGVLDTVSLAGERARLAALAAGHPGVHWDRLLFSVKESVYKAWYPLTGRWLDFAEADVTLDPDAGTFHAALCPREPAAITAFSGRYLVRAGLVLTAIVDPAG